MERRSATLADDQEVPDPVLLRDPADLSPAERTHDLVAAVVRDDLLAVVLVLQNSYPEQVIATGQSTLQETRPPPLADFPLVGRHRDRTDCARNRSAAPSSAGRHPSPDHAVPPRLRATRNCASSCAGRPLLRRQLASLARMADGRRATGYVPLFRSNMKEPEAVGF